jgi:hypothetical protein
VSYTRIHTHTHTRTHAHTHVHTHTQYISAQTIDALDTWCHPGLDASELVDLIVDGNPPQGARIQQKYFSRMVDYLVFYSIEGSLMVDLIAYKVK